MFMLYIWLAVVCIGLVIEAINAGTLITVWFSVGAIIPLIMSFWDINTPVYICVQILIFGVVTSLCLIFLRKITMKLLFKNKDEKTNLDLYVGKKLKISSVREDISYIKFNGIEYRAVLDNGENLGLEDKVEIIKFQGNRAIVKKVN